MNSDPRSDGSSTPAWAAGPDPQTTDPLAAYQRGREKFMGVELHIAPGVLVPRPETELLGRAALRFIEATRSERPGDELVRIIDMCCGSGNLACALAAAVPAARVWACDLTDQCVQLAARNVAELGLSDRVRVLQGDLFAPLAAEGLEGRTDVIVCNPPYIPTAMLAVRTDLRHEPKEAFDGGPYGLSILTRVLREAPRYLRPGGGLFVEVGPREESQAQELLKRAKRFSDIEVERDQAGVVRFVHGRLTT